MHSAHVKEGDFFFCSLWLLILYLPVGEVELIYLVLQSLALISIKFLFSLLLQKNGKLILEG